jgi:hypothetical protein
MLEILCDRFLFHAPADATNRRAWAAREGEAPACRKTPSGTVTGQVRLMPSAGFNSPHSPLYKDSVFDPFRRRRRIPPIDMPPTDTDWRSQ